MPEAIRRFNAAEQERDEARSERDEMLAILRAQRERREYCPVCGRSVVVGCREDCRLEALMDTRGVTP